MRASLLSKLKQLFRPGLEQPQQVGWEKVIQPSVAPQLIIRTSSVYAAQGANFLRSTNRLARERDELRLVTDQFGAPTSASSIVETVAMILARSASAAELANSGSTSWHGLQAQSPGY